MNTTEMTPEQIRVRCAEIEGWKTVGFPSELHENCQIRCGENPSGYWAEIPDYTNSIDAINVAVLRLPRGRQIDWVNALLDSIPDATLSMLATASAIDRAKAFVSIHQT